MGEYYIGGKMHYTLGIEIMESLRRWGESATWQLADRLRRPPNSVSSSLRRLLKDGRVIRSTDGLYRARLRAQSRKP